MIDVWVYVELCRKDDCDHVGKDKLNTIRVMKLSRLFVSYVRLVVFRGDCPAFLLDSLRLVYCL